MADSEFTLLPSDKKNKWGRSLYERRCRVCGAVKFVQKCDLNSRCRSCATKASNFKHGFSAGGHTHPLYKVIDQMIHRCGKPSHPAYQWYGARGIRVCDEWRINRGSFIEWGLANGWRKGLTIDRIDNDGNYEPTNCRFVSRIENNRNARPRGPTMVRRVK